MGQDCFAFIILEVLYHPNIIKNTKSYFRQRIHQRGFLIWCCNSIKVLIVSTWSQTFTSIEMRLRPMILRSIPSIILISKGRILFAWDSILVSQGINLISVVDWARCCFIFFIYLKQSFGSIPHSNFRVLTFALIKVLLQILDRDFFFNLLDLIFFLEPLRLGLTVFIHSMLYVVPRRTV